MKRHSTKNARRRPGDRPDYDSPTMYAHELHELAAAISHSDRQLSKLWSMAQRHGVPLGIGKTCATLKCAILNLKTAARHLVGR